MDKSNRPMFVIKNTKEIHLNENETSSNTLADIDGAEKFTAEKNKSGIATNTLTSNKEKSTSIKHNILNFILENIRKIIITIITAAVLTYLGLN